MNVIKISLLSLAFTCISLCSNAQYIQVDDTYTAQQLIQNVLVNSPCANVSNITVSGDNFSPGAQSFGFFDAGTSGFSFANGIVMSTSRAKRTEGPNDNLIDEGSTSWLGDADLEQALGISNTFNATILEFDFTPLTSKVSFDYLFASEEYHGSATCTYSDGFAFLLKVAGSPNPYQNLALIPNTTTPVLVTTVHPDIPGSCAAQNEQYFGGFNGVNAPINFDGQTVPLTAKANVIPGTTYHIKLVIADHENIRYDSAIFLSGESFSVGVDLGDDQIIATGNPVCSGETYVLDATESGATSYKWFKDNVQIPGAIGATYTVSQPGIYRVEIGLGTSGCIATGEVTIEYAALPTLVNTTLVQCDGDSDNNAIFNLNKASSIVTNGDPNIGPVIYYESLADAQAGNTNIINDPLHYASGPRTIYAFAANQYGCSSMATVLLQISNNSIANFPLLETCDYDPNPVQDGFYHFTLSDANPQVVDGLPLGLIVEYYDSYANALEGTSPLPDLYSNTQANNQTIYAKILNGPDCYGIIPVNLVVNTLAPPNFDNVYLSICPSQTATLSVPDIYSIYNWSNGATGASITVTTAGTYTVTVMENGCSATKTFVITNPEPPQITSVDVNDLTVNENTILIHYSGSGSYEFSIDGVHFQNSPYFSGLAAGTYTAIVRDQSGCGSDSENVTVVNFPRYFTPNGDGFNDYWQVPGLTSQANVTVSIFDRYGKLIIQFNGNSKGWDGKMHSKDLPSEDYWFVMTLENGKVVKGHFSLKR